MSLDLRPPAWTEHALCIGQTSRDRDWWCPDDDTNPDDTLAARVRARRICSACPVRVDCLADALADLPYRDLWTMRGGLTPGEITRLARTLGLPARRRALHGTRSRYVAGCRCDDCRNAHRVYEHSRRLWARKRTVTFPILTVPLGRGRHRAWPGQYLLTTVGLPTTYLEETA